MIYAKAPQQQLLDSDTIRDVLTRGLAPQFSRQRVLVLIPDHTRSIPLPQLFRMLIEVLDDTEKLDFMVALGTHPALSAAQLNSLVGITQAEREHDFQHIGLFNHSWDNPATLKSIGTLSQSQVQQIAGERWHETLAGDVDIRINRAIQDYDHILILGPSFPHEVAGFSGGAKYLFPGISGPEMINKTHWLGALSGVRRTIGIRDTPVREMIHAATEHVQTPLTLIALSVVKEGLAAVFIGDHIEAWQAAVEVSQERHIIWVDKPFERILSWAPPMYDELWTAGKAMYKLEPALAEGGELTIYAPHLDTVSHVHGKYIYEIGYHVLPYFLNQWEKFKHVPLGVTAHSTHVRGDGDYRDGVEYPRASVHLATQLSPEDCQQLALGYRDPAKIRLEDWQDREAEGVLFVAKAGEMLYKVRS
jgi:nickel-dependent lactate racemase